MSPDVLGEWLKGEPGALVLWPVAWRGEGLDGDELGPASTARPWVVLEAAVVRRPRRPRVGMLLGLAITLALMGPDSEPTRRMIAAHLKEDE